MKRIFVIDDADLMRDAVCQSLVRAGHAVRGFASAADALAAMRDEQPLAVVTDMKMPQMTGIEMLRQMRTGGIESPCIIMTAYGTVETAVEAMKLGATDYILKPFKPEQIELLVDRAIETAAIRQENDALRASLRDAWADRRMVGSSSVMQRIERRIAQVAASPATVLITGESGTGKEMVARAIHFSSPRAKAPFLCLNCAAISANLLESELFGHEKGAFTGADKLRRGRFELAEGGTLLLDEVSEIDLNLQAKLLRVLQEREFERVGSSLTRRVDTRVIATSNRDLGAAVAEGRFREDLFYRLNVVPIHLPPLREHREDVLELAEYFLERFTRREGRKAMTLDPAARRALLAYDWPGNVREVENVMERSVVLQAGDVLTADVLSSWLREAAAAREGANDRLVAGTPLEEVEKRLIRKTLAKFNGHRKRTAAALGIAVRTLGMKIKRWDLDAPPETAAANEEAHSLSGV
jgi:DNA-binding NtrC family response regulator